MISSVQLRGAADDHPPRDPQRPAQRAGCAAAASTRAGQRTRRSRCTTWPGSSSRSRTWPRSERFAHAFGFTTVSRTADELQLRGTDAGAPCVIVRRGPRSRYLGAAFRAADPTDVVRLADATGREVASAAGEPRRDHRGPDRSERGAGPGGRRHPRAAPRCRSQPTAAAQLRARRAPAQRHAASAARAREGPAAGARRAADPPGTSRP